MIECSAKLKLLYNIHYNYPELIYQHLLTKLYHKDFLTYIRTNCSYFNSCLLFFVPWMPVMFWCICIILVTDAVTVVLYNMMKTFNKMDHIPPQQVSEGGSEREIESLSIELIWQRRNKWSSEVKWTANTILNGYRISSIRCLGISQ